MRDEMFDEWYIALSAFDLNWDRITSLAEQQNLGRYNVRKPILKLPEYQAAFDAMEALRAAIKREGSR